MKELATIPKGPTSGIYLLCKVAQNLIGYVTALKETGNMSSVCRGDDTNRKLILRERKEKAALDDIWHTQKGKREVSGTFGSCYFVYEPLVCLMQNFMEATKWRIKEN